MDRWISNAVSLLCWVIATAVPCLADTPFQASIADLLALPEARVRDGLPVIARGVITYIEPGRRMAFLQDETAAIYVHLLSSQGVVAGDQVEVRGFLDPGYGGRNIRGSDFQTSPVIRRLGEGKFPDPVRLMNLDRAGDADGARWTRIEVTIDQVEATGDRVMLRIAGKPSIPVFMPEHSHRDSVPGHLKGVHVRIDGVFADSPISDSPRVMRRIFLTPSIDHIFVPPDEKARLFELAECGLSELQWIPEKSGPDARVKVRGSVTWTLHGGGFFVQSGASAAWVSCAESPLPQLGQSVVCAGRPASFHGSGVLVDAMWRPSDEASGDAELTGEAVAELNEGGHQGRLSLVTARLVETLRSPEETLLVLNNSEGVIFAHLTEDGTSSDIPEFEPNSQLSIQGVLLNSPSPGFDFRFTDGAVHLLSRKSGDIRLVQSAPYWTSTRLMVLLSSVLIVTLVAMVWGILLRRKVRQQSEIIRDNVRREVVHAERLRMARQWHDTFEQHFAGLTMQLDAAASTVPRHSKAHEMLDRAAMMSDHSRAVAREAIWDLRSPSGTNDTSLFSQLKETISAAWPDEFSSRIRVEADDESMVLSQHTTTTLVRIAQEAVTNAVKHSGSDEIFISWRRVEVGWELTVSDQGSGIAKESLDSASLHGHFGILGMKERASRIGARLTFESPRPGGTHGTVVRVCLDSIPS